MASKIVNLVIRVGLVGDLRGDGRRGPSTWVLVRTIETELGRERCSSLRQPQITAAGSGPRFGS